MTRRPGDQAPPGDGGHAAERLRQFRQARQPTGPAPETSAEPSRAPESGGEREEDNEKSNVPPDGDGV